MEVEFQNELSMHRALWDFLSQNTEDHYFLLDLETKEVRFSASFGSAFAVMEDGGPPLYRRGLAEDRLSQGCPQAAGAFPPGEEWAASDPRPGVPPGPEKRGCGLGLQPGRLRAGRLRQAPLL